MDNLPLNLDVRFVKNPLREFFAILTTKSKTIRWLISWHQFSVLRDEITLIAGFEIWWVVSLNITSGSQILVNSNRSIFSLGLLCFTLWCRIPKINLEKKRKDFRNILKNIHYLGSQCANCCITNHFRFSVVCCKTSFCSELRKKLVIYATYPWKNSKPNKISHFYSEWSGRSFSTLYEC